MPAWQLGATGRGVAIGIVDTGIDPTNSEFAGRISSASADVAGNRGVVAEDDHGTQVALVAAAARNNSGIVGIAWEATVMALRADSPGSCGTTGADAGCTFSDSAIAAGIDRAVQNGAKVVNLSLGGSTPNSQVRSAIGRAAAAGVVVVVAAGNDADDPAVNLDPSKPDPFAIGIRQAGNGNVIIAGSVNDAGALSAFSNRAGSEADWYLMALGERVCCVYTGSILKTTTDDTGQTFVYVVSGTSFSAPQIAGAAALLFQAFPNLTANQVVDLLLRTARDAGDGGTDVTYGRGIMDIGRAFAPQGSMALAGGATMELADSALVTSAAMGDAVGKSPSLSAAMLDSYGRAYAVNLSRNLLAAQVLPRLAPALAAQTRSLAAGAGPLSLAVSIDARGGMAALPWSGHLRLMPETARKAQVLAARATARIAPRATLAFGYAQGADGLVAQVQGAREPAFYVARSPLVDLGLLRSDGLALAVRRDLGRWGLTVSAEDGASLAATPLPAQTGLAARRPRGGLTRFGLAIDRQWGAVSTTLAASWLAEQTSILGARLHRALGPGGADTLFVDASVGWDVTPGLRLGGAFRQAFTRARPGGLVVPGSHLAASGWSFDAEASSVLRSGDRLALRITQPLRVTGGGLLLNLPTSWDYATRSATRAPSQLGLTPRGRELAQELSWRAPLLGGEGGMNLYYRHDPGHFAGAPDDAGIAVNWNGRF